MNTRQPLLLTALAAFTGGVLTGLLMAPYSGRETRRRVTQTAQGSTQWMEGRLQDLRAQLGTLEEQVQDASSKMSARVRQTAKNTVGTYVPTLPDDAEKWKMGREDVDRDLRHLPRT